MTSMNTLTVQSVSDQAPLKEDLSKLGEMLAIRGDFEDELLEALSS